MAEKKYRTRQRDSILAFFASHPDACLSAKDIIESPEIEAGEATVFRCLAHLTEEGLIKKYTSDEGALYQYNRTGECNHHFHLKCLHCGTIVHLDCDVLRSVSEHIGAHHRFAVDVSRTVIYGICENCQPNRTNE
ncbi:MAG: transcriptional repressor [Clostridia bacterium]|nr:transcriptional repressor [Clostridia bacterium]